MGSILTIIIYGVISYLIAKSGEKRKIGFGLSLVLCLFLSPLLGGIITMLSPKIIKS